MSLHRDGRYLVVVDMASVEFMDSSGLGVLIGALKRARANSGTLVLAAVQERVMRRLLITGVTQVLRVFETLAEAIAYVERTER
jgi:anti-sigma B factor antagonist